MCCILIHHHNDLWMIWTRFTRDQNIANNAPAPRTSKVSPRGSALKHLYITATDLTLEMRLGASRPGRFAA